MNWKKIEPGAFRALAENEVRILFIRHAEHKENITLPEDAQRLMEQGKRLAAAGIIVSGAISSPADRAISAVYFTKAGMGVGGYTVTDPRLADMKAEDPELVKQLKADAKAAGVEAEAYIFTMCQQEPTFRAMMHRRGVEGCNTLAAFTEKFCGQTILSTSHGGSRMEVVIAALADRLDECLNSGPEVLLDRGQIAELIINDDRSKLVELHYLEPLQRDAQ